MRVLALDYGAARCGCALSDPTGTLATPIEPVLRPATRKGFGRVCDLVREREVDRVIVGLPLSLAGGDSAQTQETRRWAASLAERLPIPVELYDERFTTLLASRDPGNPISSEDSRAAAHLLTGWLAARAGADPTPSGREAG
ncbi:MAG: Holliday junction resolvase RuvX [Actinobacteria bacterium]|nr:Holliday junction resolvase RuvX [Actinomycetota bacterium]